MSDNRPAEDVSQNEVDLFLSTLRAKGTPWGDGCASLINKLWTEVRERRIEVEKYKAWAASCDPSPPVPAPLTSNTKLAEQFAKEFHASGTQYPLDRNEWRAILMFAEWLDKRTAAETIAPIDPRLWEVIDRVIVKVPFEQKCFCERCTAMRELQKISLASVTARNTVKTGAEPT